MAGNAAGTTAINQKRPAPAEELPQRAKKHKINFCDEIAVEFADHVFRVPSVLLRSRSSFAARETRHGLLQISNKSSLTMHMFSTYLQLLYTGEVVLNEPDETMTAARTYRQLNELYCLCEALQDPTSMNLVIKELAHVFGKALPWSQKRVIIQRIYGITEPGSMVRELILDLAAVHWKQRYEWAPQGFKDGLLYRLQELRDDPERAEAIRSKVNFPERYFVPS